MIASLLPQLADFSGEVIDTESDDYVTATRAALGGGGPALILRPTDTSDVQRAVRIAAASGLALAIRGGGHSAAGLSTVEDGIVIDLRALNTVEMVGGNHVRVGGGAKWRHVLDVLTPLGLAISSGDTADVGVGGLTLSGGIGWMVRQHGLTLDHLRAVEIVTAAGDVLIADADHHAELFWALRGGGGAYGVVTAFEFEAQPVHAVAFATLTFPAEAAERIVGGWASHMRSAPHAISSTLTLANALAGDRVAPVEVLLVRSDGQGLDDSVDALCGVATPMSASEQRVSYSEILHPGADLPAGLRASVRSGFIGAQNADAAASAVARIATQEQPATLVLHSLGGAFSEVSSDSTAFAHRYAEIMVTTFAVGSEEDTGAIRSRLTEVWSELDPFVDGSYANSLDGASADAVVAIYPEDTRTRLNGVKEEYDPDNLFSRNFGPRARSAIASMRREEIR